MSGYFLASHFDPAPLEKYTLGTSNLADSPIPSRRKANQTKTQTLADKESKIQRRRRWKKISDSANAARVASWHNIRASLHEHGAVILRTDKGHSGSCPVSAAGLTWLWVHSLKGDRHHAVSSPHSYRADNGVFFFDSQGEDVGAFSSVWLRHKLPHSKDVFRSEGNATAESDRLISMPEGSLPLYIKPAFTSLSECSAYLEDARRAAMRRSYMVNMGKNRCQKWITSLCSKHAFVALLRDEEQSTEFVDVFQVLDMTAEEMREMESKDHSVEGTAMDTEDGGDYSDEMSISEGGEGIDSDQWSSEGSLY